MAKEKVRKHQTTDMGEVTVTTTEGFEFIPSKTPDKIEATSFIADIFKDHDEKPINELQVSKTFSSKQEKQKELMSELTKIREDLEEKHSK